MGVRAGAVTRVSAFLDTQCGSCLDVALPSGVNPASGVSENSSPTDVELLLQVQDRNTAAMARLYDRHGTAVLRLALKILRHRSDAEDLVHDVFVEAWQCASQYRQEKASVKTWLLLRTRSRALDRLRRLDLARRHAMAAQPQLHTGSDSAQQSDQDLAARTLGRLTRVQQEVVELAYYRGFTCQEIADRCDIPIGTVKSRLAGSIKKLRELLLGREQESDDQASDRS